MHWVLFISSTVSICLTTFNVYNFFLHFQSAHLTPSVAVCQMARLDVFPTTSCRGRAWNPRHVSLVAPTWVLSMDALPTQLPRRSLMWLLCWNTFFKTNMMADYNLGLKQSKPSFGIFQSSHKSAPDGKRIKIKLTHASPDRSLGGKLID